MSSFQAINQNTYDDTPTQVDRAANLAPGIHNNSPFSFGHTIDQCRPNLPSNLSTSTTSTARSAIFEQEDPFFDNPESPSTPPEEYYGLGHNEVPRRSTSPSESPSLPVSKARLPIRPRVREQSSSNGSNSVGPVRRPVGRPRKTRLSEEGRQTRSSPIRSPPESLEKPSARRASTAATLTRTAPPARTSRVPLSQINNSDAHSGRPAAVARSVSSACSTSISIGIQEALPGSTGEPQNTRENNHAAEPPVDESPPFQEQIYSPKYNKSKTPLEINRLIYRNLHKSRQQNPPENKKSGWVYIFRSSTHLKVGYTHDAPQVRQEALEKCLGALETVEQDYENPFQFPYIVEQLVLAEFHNQRKKSPCDRNPNCRTNEHGEWLKETLEAVLVVRNRWRTWMRTQQPYDSNQKLTPYWSYRVQQAKERLSDIDWDEWTTPSWWDAKCFKLHESWESYICNSRKDVRFICVGTLYTYFGWLLRGWWASFLVIIALLAL